MSGSLSIKNLTLVAGLISVTIISGCFLRNSNAENADGVCAYQIIKARAWVNRMPKIIEQDAQTPKNSNMLHVALTFSNNAAFGVLEENSDLTTTDTLVLNLSEGATSKATEEGAKFSKPMPRPAYQSVSIRCTGQEIHSIETIAKVY